jgi:hypothetical protein
MSLAIEVSQSRRTNAESTDSLGFVQYRHEDNVMSASAHLELLVICDLEVALEESGLEQLCLNEIS